MVTTSRQTPARRPAGRDHGLNGPESARAVSAGLADAQWYRPWIAPGTARALLADGWIPLTTHRVDVVDGRLVADLSPPSAR